MENTDQSQVSGECDFANNSDHLSSLETAGGRWFSHGARRPPTHVRRRSGGRRSILSSARSCGRSFLTGYRRRDCGTAVKKHAWIGQSERVLELFPPGKASETADPSQKRRPWTASKSFRSVRNQRSKPEKPVPWRFPIIGKRSRVPPIGQKRLNPWLPPNASSAS
jgi:hypothetical protein